MAKPPGDSKHDNILIRVTADQKARLQRRASEAGFKGVGPYMVHIGLGGEHRKAARSTEEEALLSRLSQQVGSLQGELKERGWSADAKAALDDAARAIRQALGWRA